MRTKQKHEVTSIYWIASVCERHKVNDIICTWCITATQYALYLFYSLLRSLAAIKAFQFLYAKWNMYCMRIRSFIALSF